MLHSDHRHPESLVTTAGATPGCSYCGRRFVLDRVDTHVEICKKVYKHKRKVYDSAKKRAQGTDMENYQSNRKRKKNWKQKHDAFLRMLRAAQQIELQIFRGTKQSDLPPPLPAENPDYVPCPHCKRRFKAEAAERHIPTCKKLRNRPPPLTLSRSGSIYGEKKGRQCFGSTTFGSLTHFPFSIDVA
uniref:C2HC/C3H-type domain-containing protein n=1 Tax=Callorhinchus milii TaxID=7868 RepID=A0A4W3H9L3_CALMI